MAFQLGSFIVQMLGDTSHLDAAMNRVQAGVQSVTNAVKGAASGGLTIPGAEAAKTTLRGAETAAKSLGSALRGLLDIDLSTVFQLGTIGGAVALMGSATKKFMELQDEAQNTQFRFRVLGMETEENTKKLFEFGKSMQNAFGIGQAEARKLSMDALTKGINPGRYQEMTSSAVQLGAALGISSQRALQVVEQLEAGNTMVLRRLHPSFRILMEQGASRYTLEAKVNEIIAQGGIIAKERMNTFGGQIQRLKTAFSGLSVAVAKAIGPAFAPVVAKFADALENVTKKLTAYIEAHKDTVGATIRTAAAVTVGAASFMLFRGRIFGLIGSIQQLLPSVQTLWTAFQVGFNFNPFRAIRAGLGGVYGALTRLTGFALQAGVQIALFIFSPTRIAAALTEAALLAYTVVVNGMAAAMGVATAAARLLSLALRGVLIASGVGLVVGFVGMILGISDTFGEASTGVNSFGTAVSEVFKSLRELAAPVLEWIKVEGVIVFRALVASARQMFDNLKDIWKFMVGLWDDVCAFMRRNFGETISWIEATFGIKIDSIKSMWQAFTAELSVLGLRIRQIFLGIGFALAAIPTILRWVWDSFKAFALFIAENWQQVLVESIRTIGDFLALLGTAIIEVGEKIGDALSGEKVDWNFSKTEEAFQKMKGQAQKILAGIQMPELDLSNVAPELRKELGKVTSEIERKKQQARDAQNAARTSSQDRGTGKTTGEQSNDPKANVLIGSRDKAHFQETVGFWKKVQEAGANQRAEYFMQQQLDQQREMVRLLGQINLAMAAKPMPPPGGVIPR